MKKIAVLLPLAGILCAGCKTVSYDPSYTRPVTMNVTPRYQGKLLVYTTPDEDKYVFHGHSKSLTGIAWDLKVPLGKMAKEMSGDIYGHLFVGGYDFGNQRDNNDGYTLILHPKVENFAWRLNQAQNLGFAITPQVRMTLDVELLSPDRKTVIFQRQYESGWESGNSYVISLSFFDNLNLAIHKTMANLMLDSIRDLDATLHQQSPQTQPMPPSFSMMDEGIPSVVAFWSTWSAEMAAMGNVPQASYSSQPHQFFPQPGFVETYITDTFEGWTGKNVWAMDNGQVWQEAQYGYHYYYAYHPKVIIFPSNGEWIMRVNGDDAQIQVQRLK